MPIVKVIVALAYWHIFFMVIRIMIITSIFFATRFKKGIIFQIPVIVILYFLIKNGLLNQLGILLLNSIKNSGEAFNFRSDNISKAVLIFTGINIGLFATLNILAKNSQNKIFKFFYEFNTTNYNPKD